jgi:D-proline reductase (dithiol) PrdB
MQPVNYLEGLNKYYQSQGFPPYKWSEFQDSPWRELKKPLDAAKLFLISSAGISMEGQERFDPWAVNDLSIRKIPVDTSFDRLRIDDNYFDHRDAQKDMNCVFPVDPLKRLQGEGVFRELAETAVTLGMGRLYKRTALRENTVPKIIDVLQEQEADAALLVAA